MPDLSVFARRAWTVAGIAALFALAVAVVWKGIGVLLLLFGAVLVAVLLDGLARLIGRAVSWPRGVRLALGGLGLVAVVGLVLWFVGPRLVEQAGQLTDEVQESVGQIQERIGQTEWGRTVLDRVPSAEEAASQSGVAGRVAAWVQRALGALTSGLLLLILGIYLAVAPRTYWGALVELVPHRHRDRVQETLCEMGRGLRYWLLGQFYAMVITGGLTTVALLLLGLPLALVLGVLTFVLAFIPYIGPIIAFIPIVLVAFMEGPQTLLWVGLIYAVVMMVESYVVTPLVQERVLSLPPALLLFSQLLLGALAGVLGLALAPPLAVCAILAVQILYVRGALHDDVPLLGTEE